jgi:hypothetical protein
MNSVASRVAGADGAEKKSPDAMVGALGHSVVVAARTLLGYTRGASP